MLKSIVGLCLMALPVVAMAAGAGDLERLAPTLSPEVAQRAAAAALCAQAAGQAVDKLIVVDMAKHSIVPRLWAFDLKSTPRLILNARVAHGSGSDPDADGKASAFSNLPNSHMTSLGLYRVAEAYQGKHGLSRRLDGLFARFNSRARERAVVLHPSTYVGPSHVGRSQGCPAVSEQTMAALEKADLHNAVLWIDGPDKVLAQEVETCAAKQLARKSEMDYQFTWPVEEGAFCSPGWRGAANVCRSWSLLRNSTFALSSG